jgi:hypothetical protein
MDDFNKPIRPISREDSDKIKSEPIIEKFREELNQNPSETKKTDKKNFIISYLTNIINFFNHFFPEKTNSSKILDNNPLCESLQIIKKFLTKIRDENPENDPKFAAAFSETWDNILDNYNHISSKNIHLNVKKIKQLIDAIDYYPEGEDHSLGFYLKHHSGKEWFPIPFFELLKTLHEEYFLNGKNSDLDRWIALASEILEEYSNTHSKK